MSAVAVARSAPAVPLQEGALLAAVDLGSNSFHMVVARHVLGQLRVVDRLRETVRLAEGLDGKGGLHPEPQQRAMDCLARFGQRVHDIPTRQVRAIATNTVRALRDPQQFLLPAEAALGHGIEVVSGREEARLIYLGVAHAQPPRPDALRLVIDIGGGSTECIIGAGFEAIERESLQVGCVTTTQRFFGDGQLSRDRWREAAAEVALQFQQFAGIYRALGWQEAIGSSGTVKAVGDICAKLGLTEGSVTDQALVAVRDRLLRAKSLEAITLPGLSEDRQPIIAGGVLVLEAAFAALGLSRIEVSKAAMREGILYDMLGRASDADPRETSVLALMQRYGVDEAQAAKVEATALRLHDAVANAWDLDADARRMLGWAARLHEIGLAIAHSQYHLHGAYVLENSDIAGFSRQEQQYLAALVRSHRRRVAKTAFDALPERLLLRARRSTALLRLAVLLQRGHETDPLPDALELRAQDRALLLELPAAWLQARPLLVTDLAGEPEGQSALGITLQVATR